MKHSLREAMLCHRAALPKTALPETALPGRRHGSGRREPLTGEGTCVVAGVSVGLGALTVTLVSQNV